jgi:hypothetical protein
MFEMIDIEARMLERTRGRQIKTGLLAAVERLHRIVCRVGIKLQVNRPESRQGLMGAILAYICGHTERKRTQKMGPLCLQSHRIFQVIENKAVTAPTCRAKAKKFFRINPSQSQPQSQEVLYNQ